MQWLVRNQLLLCRLHRFCRCPIVLRMLDLLVRAQAALARKECTASWAQQVACRHIHWWQQEHCKVLGQQLRNLAGCMLQTHRTDTAHRLE